MNIALVLAAGSGTRMNANQPKQFIVVNGKPLFIYSVEKFQNNQNVDAIVIATNKENITKVEELVKGYNKVKSVIAGGKTRQQSVYNGIQEIAKLITSEKDLILIHDSARPLVSDAIIDENIALGKRYGAVDTVVQASDTIINSKNKETINETLNRSELYQAQTPQTFEYGIIRKAHKRALLDNIPNVTDDCKLVMNFGVEVHFAKGDKFNFKVTTPEDLELFKALLK
ncbi:MAG: 2-C-methyl-D-erythritol 4-phosphate cytidylyltransferase [Bacilli bacterium]|nr:2-C-methyl-D-erythritol 4-phosphate cytidylyltransferase [Bacilli bacterium]